MKPIVMIVIMMLTAAGGFCSGDQENTDITVFAAASTTDLVNAVADVFREKYGAEIKLNPASSGTLARQIEQGAEPDIYISASGEWMKYVAELDLLSVSGAFMGNRLVLICPGDTDFKDFEIVSGSEPPSFDGRISIADPAHAPAGRYAVEALKSLGWYVPLENRLQPGADVRAALSVVEFGECELGIVYRTDAVVSDKVRIISVFPEESHSPIGYYCGLLKNSSSIAKDFYYFLTESQEADSLIRDAGFSR